MNNKPLGKTMYKVLNTLSASSLLIALSCQLFTTVNAASNEMYQWKDKNGRMHFSDTPPLGHETKTKQMSVDFIKEQAQAKSEEKNEKTAPTEQANDNSEQEPETSSLKNKAECKKVRASLAQLKSKRPLRYTNDKGEVGIITAAERNKQIKRLKKLESDYCK